MPLETEELLAAGSPGEAENRHRPDALRRELVLEHPRLERGKVLRHQGAAEDLRGVLGLARVVLLPVCPPELGVGRQDDPAWAPSTARSPRRRSRGRPADQYGLSIRSSKSAGRTARRQRRLARAFVSPAWGDGNARREGGESGVAAMIVPVSWILLRPRVVLFEARTPDEAIVRAGPLSCGSHLRSHNER